MQTEELLTKRRDLLERKIAHELERAKELTKQGNKRGEQQALNSSHWKRVAKDVVAASILT